MMTWLRKTIGAIVLISLSCLVFADPPPFSGVVIRDEAPFAISWIDPEAGLRVIIGADMDEFCADTFNFDLIAFQDVNLPSGRIVSNMSAIMQTTVWDFLEFDCAMFTTIDPVASGFAKLRGLDNDLTGSVVNNTNAWTWMVHGKLEDPWGTRMILSGHITRQFREGEPVTVLTSQIVLH